MIILILAIFFSCKNKQNKIDALIDAAETTPAMANIPDSVRKKQRLDHLVFEITSLERLEGRYIGIDGHKSNQTDYAGELGKLADTNYLSKLTTHSSPYLRVVAFQALLDNNYSQIEEIFRQHLNDNSTYQLYSGCLITPEPVNLTMFNLLRYKLTDEAQTVYYEKIMEQLKKSNYWLANIQ
ncbi:MAG TPA: hypothetical protein VL946_08700 [Lacibacter sp.]|jgi:hypothetical protein|nr:hypothetical protein [Lacibacter sp.]